MIIVKQSRLKDGVIYPSKDGEKNPFSAVDFLICYELAFGCEVSDITETSLTVQTCIMDCIDTTSFTGSPEEMLWLNKIAAVYTLIKSRIYTPEHRELVVAKVLHATQGHPALMDVATGMIVGGSFAKSAVVALLAEGASEKVPLLMKFNLPELMTMLEWKIVDNLPLEEIFELAS